MRQKICCICNELYIGYGNNPWPVKDEGECCDNCNFEKVIPARLEDLRKSDEQSDL